MKVTVDLVDYEFESRREEVSSALHNALEAVRNCFLATGGILPVGGGEPVPVPAAISAVHNALCLVHREMEEWRRESWMITGRALRLPFDPRYDFAYDEETSAVLKFAAAPAADDVEFRGVREALLRDLVALSEVVNSNDESLRCRGAPVFVIDAYFETLVEPFLNLHGVYRIMLHCFAVRREQKATGTTEP